MDIVYYSNVSENTHRFVEKVGGTAYRLPFRAADDTHETTKPYVLIVPTYGGGHEGGAVPAPVIRFLNNRANRDNIRGVVGAGNTNFGDSYCKAASIVSAKIKVPTLMQFELMGTKSDVQEMRDILKKLEEAEDDNRR